MEAPQGQYIINFLRIATGAAPDRPLLQPASLGAGAPWLHEYEMELIAFNKGAHDDQVDVTAYAAICVIGPMNVNNPNNLDSFSLPSFGASQLGMRV